MAVTIKTSMLSVGEILKRHGLENDGRVIRYIRGDVDRLMNPYVPFDTGGLRRLKTYPNNHSIKYTSPYALYMYMGKLMLAKNGSCWAKLGEKKVKTNKNLKYHTSGTGAKWDKLMLQRRKKELEQDVQNYIKRGGIT